MKYALLVVDLKGMREPQRREYRTHISNIGELEPPTERLGEGCWLIPVSSDFDHLPLLLGPIEQLGISYRIAFYDDPVCEFVKR